MNDVGAERSRLKEVIEEWKKAPPYEGVRGAEPEDIEALDDESVVKIDTILDAMDWPQLIIFHYGESDRVVAPFVVGISSEGNPLLRGYQLEGESRSGKGAGWRVFQVGKMEEVGNHQDFFDPLDFDFNPLYPWIFKVFKMAEGVEIDLSLRHREFYGEVSEGISMEVE